jgi:hypothetical protein
MLSAINLNCLFSNDGSSMFVYSIDNPSSENIGLIINILKPGTFINLIQGTMLINNVYHWGFYIDAGIIQLGNSYFQCLHFKNRVWTDFYESGGRLTTGRLLQQVLAYYNIAPGICSSVILSKLDLTVFHR